MLSFFLIQTTNSEKRKRHRQSRIHHTIHRILGLFRKNPIGFMLLIIIPATLLIITEIRKITENTKKSSQKQPTKISEAPTKPTLYTKNPKKEKPRMLHNRQQHKIPIQNNSSTKTANSISKRIILCWSDCSYSLFWFVYEKHGHEQCHKGSSDAYDEGRLRNEVSV